MLSLRKLICRYVAGQVATLADAALDAILQNESKFSYSEKELFAKQEYEPSEAK